MLFPTGGTREFRSAAQMCVVKALFYPLKFLKWAAELSLTALLSVKLELLIIVIKDFQLNDANRHLLSWFLY